MIMDEDFYSDIIEIDDISSIDDLEPIEYNVVDYAQKQIDFIKQNHIIDDVNYASVKLKELYTKVDDAFDKLLEVSKHNEDLYAFQVVGQMSASLAGIANSISKNAQAPAQNNSIGANNGNGTTNNIIIAGSMQEVLKQLEEAGLKK